MSTIEQCDGCGALSPDDEGLYHGNHWFEVKVKSRSWAFNNRFYHPNEMLFCEKCMGIQERQPHPFPSAVIRAIKRLCRIGKEASDE